jgi:hypothetical protein
MPAVLREALFTEYLVATRVIISRTHPTAALRDDSQCRQCRLLALLGHKAMSDLSPQSVE